MGSTGGSSGGFIGFVNSIPLWLYIAVAVLGLLITILLFVLSGRSRRNGGGGGAMAGGIMALLVLTIAPATLMTIGLLNGPSKSTTVNVADGSSSTSSGSSSGGFPSSTSSSSSSSGGYGSTSGGTTSSSSSGGAFGMSIEDQVTAAAQMLQAQTPIQQGPVTITSARANGNELIIGMTVPAEIDDAKADTMRQGAMTSQCANAQVAQLINSGVKYTYTVTDSRGEETSFSIDHC